MLVEEVEPCCQSSVIKAFLGSASGIWVVLSSIVLIVDSQSVLGAILCHSDIDSTSVARCNSHWHRFIEIWLGCVLLTLELLHVFYHHLGTQVIISHIFSPSFSGIRLLLALVAIFFFFGHTWYNDKAIFFGACIRWLSLMVDLSARTALQDWLIHWQI